MAERSSGLCEVVAPGVCRGRAESVHHRRKKGQGGTWDPSNLVAVCGHGTAGCHGHIEANPVWASGQGLWLRAGEDSLTTPARLRWGPVRGWFTLDDEGMLRIESELEPLSGVVQEMVSPPTSWGPH